LPGRVALPLGVREVFPGRAIRDSHPSTHSLLLFVL
jgi:hypothetical protein